MDTEKFDPDLLLKRILKHANLLNYYENFVALGGDDIRQLCEADEDEFLEIMSLVGMSTKPLHVRRLQKTLQLFSINSNIFTNDMFPQEKNEIKPYWINKDILLNYNNFLPNTYYNSQSSGQHLINTKVNSTNLGTALLHPDDNINTTKYDNVFHTAFNSVLKDMGIEIINSSNTSYTQKYDLSASANKSNNQSTPPNKSSIFLAKRSLTNEDRKGIKLSAQKVIDNLPSNLTPKSLNTKKPVNKEIEDLLSITERNEVWENKVRTYGTIYGRFDSKRRDKPMTLHEQFVNEAAIELCIQRPELLTRRDELFPLARQVVRHSGYQYTKKSRFSTDSNRTDGGRKILVKTEPLYQDVNASSGGPSNEIAVHSADGGEDHNMLNLSIPLTDLNDSSLLHEVDLDSGSNNNNNTGNANKSADHSGVIHTPTGATHQSNYNILQNDSPKKQTTFTHSSTDDETNPNVRSSLPNVSEEANKYRSVNSHSYNNNNSCGSQSILQQQQKQHFGGDHLNNNAKTQLDHGDSIESNKLSQQHSSMLTATNYNGNNNFRLHPNMRVDNVASQNPSNTLYHDNRISYPQITHTVLTSSVLSSATNLATHLNPNNRSHIVGQQASPFYNGGLIPEPSTESKSLSSSIVYMDNHSTATNDNNNTNLSMTDMVSSHQTPPSFDTFLNFFTNTNNKNNNVVEQSPQPNRHLNNFMAGTPQHQDRRNSSPNQHPMFNNAST